MSDLISRKALLHEIQHGSNKPEIYDGAQEVDWILECINEIPTAYDVDKVVSSIKLHIEDWKKFSGQDIAEEHIKALTWVLDLIERSCQG